MRIAVLNWRDERRADAGGAELLVHELTRHWAEWGHDVELVCSEHRALARTEDNRGVHVVRSGHLRTGGHHLFGPRRAASGSPDVIFESINTIPYMLPLRVRRGTPYVSLVHQMAYDVWEAHMPGPIARVATRFEPLLYRPYRNKHMLTYSQSTADDLRGAGVRDVSVIPQGGGGPQELGDKAAVPTFVYAARLAANKRPDHAIEAFKIIRQSLPDARLYVIGDGEMKTELERTRPPGVELLGWLSSHDEVLKIMGTAHLLLATSIREGWGLVVTEANSVGTPAVTYDVPGFRDSVRHGETGLLTEPCPRALAQGALELLEDRDRYDKYRDRAIEWGSNRTWEDMAGAVIGHLARAAGRDEEAEAHERQEG